MQGNEPEAPEQDRVLIIDKIIKVSEQACVNTDADKTAIQHELDCLQSSVAELAHDSPQGGDINAHSNSSCVGNGGFKAQRMVQELTLADYQHVSEHREVISFCSPPPYFFWSCYSCILK